MERGVAVYRLTFRCQTVRLRSVSTTRPSAAEILRAHLDERGWSQARLGKEITVSTAVVSRWLSGDRSPSLEMACRIEAALGIPVATWRS